jgi:hypothetical protein
MVVLVDLAKGATMDTPGATQTAPPKSGVNVRMFVAIGAIVIALIAGYLAWS